MQRALGVAAVLISRAVLAQDGGVGWRPVQLPMGPVQRYAAALVYDDLRNRTILFGGCPTNPNGGIGDTWEWDGATWTLVGPNAANPYGPYSAYAFDSARGVMVLIGGQYTAGTWIWDGGVWAQVSDAGAASRWFSAAAYDSRRQRTVMFGGQSLATGTVAGDTWEWDGATWQQVADGGPPPRYGHCMAYDSARGKTILFGGTSFTAGNFGDTWEWDGMSWVRVADADAGPGAFVNASLAFDSRRARAVLYGYGTGPAGTWEWDGSTWLSVTDAGPDQREYAPMVFDAARGVTVMFGGYGNAIYADTWIYTGPDAGPFDAGPPLDAGRPLDAGSASDAGFGGDGGSGPPPTHNYRVACASSGGAQGVWLALVALALLRKAVKPLTETRLGGRR